MFKRRKGTSWTAAAVLLAVVAALPAHGDAVLNNPSNRKLTLDLAPIKPMAGWVAYSTQRIDQGDPLVEIGRLNLFEPDTFKKVVVEGGHRLVISMRAFEDKPATLTYAVSFENGLAGQSMSFEVMHKSELKLPDDSPDAWKSIPELFLLKVPVDLATLREDKAPRCQNLGFYRVEQKRDTELVFDRKPIRRYSTQGGRSAAPRRLPSVRESSWEDTPRGGFFSCFSGCAKSD